MIYVGKSNDIDQRIAQHEHSKGFLVELPTITEPLHNDHESWERNETLAQMNKHGIEKVRGWMYTTKILTKSNVKSIQEQLCEKFDLCRVCGLPGHFASDCKEYSEEPSSSDESYDSD